jgi:Flp pilus assembly pilin Flp
LKSNLKAAVALSSGGAGRSSRYRQAAQRAAKTPSTREQGQTLVEYSLIVSVFAIALLAVITLIGGDITGFYESVRGELAGLDL